MRTADPILTRFRLIRTALVAGAVVTALFFAATCRESRSSPTAPNSATSSENRPKIPQRGVVEIEGLVSAVGDNTLTVSDERLGSVMVHVVGSTIIREGRTALTLSQILVGMRVHVRATAETNGKFTAIEIIIQNERTKTSTPGPPTSTPTATATPTATSIVPTTIPSSTPTVTVAVPTPTNTSTPTVTSIVPTSTPSGTPTVTVAAPTSTSTSTPTVTSIVPTATPSSTPTVTSIVPTPTPSSTPTVTLAAPTATSTSTPGP